MRTDVPGAAPVRTFLILALNRKFFKALFDCVQLQLKILRLIFERLFFHFRIRRGHRRVPPAGPCSYRCAARVKAVAPAKSARVKAPSKSSAPSKPHAERSCRSVVHVTGRGITRAKSGAPSRHRAHAHRACCISSRHNLYPPFLFSKQGRAALRTFDLCAGHAPFVRLRVATLGATTGSDRSAGRRAAHAASSAASAALASPHSSACLISSVHEITSFRFLPVCRVFVDGLLDPGAYPVRG